MKAGIDLGGTKIQAVVVDDAHEVRGQARLRHLPHQCREGFRCFTDPFTP